MLRKATQSNRQLAVFTVLEDDSLLLESFEGREALSELSQFELTLLSAKHEIAPDQLLGTNVTWVMTRDQGAPRFFNGYVTEFGHLEHTARGVVYQAKVAPWPWFLTQSTDCRIFQEMTTLEIINQVVDDFGFLGDFDESQIRGDYEPREFCVQYRETAFAFCSRLMEEEGISYYFRHENGRHTLVLFDSPDGYHDVEESDLAVARWESLAGSTTHAVEWQQEHQLRPGRWSTRDYDFERPQFDVAASVSSQVEHLAEVGLEIYEYPGRYRRCSLGSASKQTRIRMEEEESRHEIIRATGSRWTFSPGARFRVTSHPNATFEGREFSLLEVVYRTGSVGGYTSGESSKGEPFVWTTEFTALSSETVYRPPRRTRQAVIRGPQTAVVVGPPGEQIHTDEHGRVRCHFHWDRRSRRDENSSCWMRVSQLHAGAKWGTVDIPRVGEEVIVAFLDGNPDRPIIKGRVYNNDTTPPFSLPEGKTRSGIKSNTHKGSGFNELSFDDTSGAEQARVNAQYNMDSAVGNNQSLQVGVDRSADVVNNDALIVGVNKSTEVGADASVTVGNNLNYVAGADVEIDSGTSITLSCGASTLHMNQGGVITVSGQFVSSLASATHSIVAPLTEIAGAQLLNQAGLVCLDLGGVCHVKGGETSVGASAIDVSGGSVVVKGSEIAIGEVGAPLAQLPAPPPPPSDSSTGKRPLTPAEYEKYTELSDRLNDKYRELLDLELKYENGELSEAEYDAQREVLEQERDSAQAELDQMREEIDFESVEWDENEEPIFDKPQPNENREPPTDTNEPDNENPTPAPLPLPVPTPSPTPIPSPTPTPETSTPPKPNDEASDGEDQGGDEPTETEESCSGTWIEGPGLRGIGVGSIDVQIADQQYYPGHVWINYQIRGEYYGKIRCNCKKSGPKEIDFSWKFDQPLSTLYNVQTMLPGFGWITMLIRVRKLFKADRIIQQNKKYLRIGVKILGDSADLICKGAFNPKQLLDVFPKYYPPGSA